MSVKILFVLALSCDLELTLKHIYSLETNDD